MLPQTQFSSFHGVEESICMDVLQAWKKQSSLWLGRAPELFLSRPSSFRSVEKSFRSDVVRTFNNVQMNGWSCSPKHGPGRFTVLKNLVIWLARSFSKTFELEAGTCSPKQGPVPLTVLKHLFVWMLCSHVNTFKLMAGPRSPTSPVTAKLDSRRWWIIAFWCYADFHQCSIERMVVFPQTRSRSFDDMEKLFRLDGNLCLGRALSNTAQTPSQCWRTLSFGHHATI